MHRSLSRFLQVALFGSLILLAAGCGSSTSAASRESTRATQITSHRENAASMIKARVLRALSGLQQDYRAGNWTGVLNSSQSMSLGLNLVQTMKYWKSEHVPWVNVSLVYGRSLDAHHYVATVHYFLDQRAMQQYAIYEFVASGRGARILGKASGIVGATYRQANWRVTRTAHFLFYHGPYQLEGTDRAAMADLEYERAQFIRKFGVKLPPLAAYYVYPDTQMMDRMTKGSCGSVPDNIGCTNPFANPPTIQAATIWPSYHEPIHVYELALAPPARPGSQMVNVAPRFISEGTAVALEDRQLDPRLSDYCTDITYVPLDTCGRAAAEHVNPLSLLSDNGFTRAPAGYAYALSGSFVKYLILRYGYRPFGRFYYVLAAQPTDHQHDYDVASNAVYHKPIATLLDEFKLALCAVGC